MIDLWESFRGLLAFSVIVFAVVLVLGPFMWPVILVAVAVAVLVALAVYGGSSRFIARLKGGR